jgi:hypothetical protein
MNIQQTRSTEDGFMDNAWFIIDLLFHPNYQLLLLVNNLSVKTFMGTKNTKLLQKSRRILGGKKWV